MMPSRFFWMYSILNESTSSFMSHRWNSAIRKGLNFMHSAALRDLAMVAMIFSVLTLLFLLISHRK